MSERGRRSIRPRVHLFVAAMLVSFAGAGCAHPQILSGPRGCVAPELALTLPFRGEPRTVIQGNGGTFSHTGRYQFAWDFSMPEGTQVVAAADGVVAEVIDRFTAGGNDRALAERANMIIVDHGGAHFSVYQHLKPAGALVRPGQPVKRGDPVGLSGSTGFSTTPHLHFAVIDHRNRSLPVCFVDVPGGVPAQGAQVQASGPPAPPSSLPSDAFADNGVLLDGPVPARRITGPFTVRGHATRPGTTVSVWVAPRERDGRTVVLDGAVGADGRFTIDVDPAKLAALGRALDLAVVLHAPDGGYHFDFSVPIALDVAAAEPRS